jgi:hypothetical protein
MKLSQVVLVNALAAIFAGEAGFVLTGTGDGGRLLIGALILRKRIRLRKNNEKIINN